jgi:hypothetical protein
VNGFATIAALWRELGPLRFLLFASVVAMIVAGFGWIHHSLTTATGWPEAYGFSCRRKCLLADMWHSPKLLAGGSGDELALFAVIWLLPSLR